MKSNESKAAEKPSKAAAYHSSGKSATSLAVAAPVRLQPKLTINDAGDSYEQEADRVADSIMSSDGLAIQTKPFAISSLQRKCTHCEAEEEQLQRKAQNNNEGVAGNELESYVGSLASSGQALPADVKNYFEPKFHHDFSNVKVHTGTLAAKSAQSINALAYTSGSNIVFNEGQFAPQTGAGKRLLAHELTHVVQQGGATHSTQRKVIQREDIGVSQSHDVSDAPYSWTASYEIVKGDTEITVILNVEMVPDGDVTADQISTLQSQTRNEFLRYWDNRFVLTDSGGTARTFRAQLNFGGGVSNQTIQVHSGGGRDDLSNWYVSGDPQTRAHELGHALGLKDEYVDPAAPSRATATSPGVFADHSIMGNYYTEGRSDADVRMRHGEELASDISSATGETFTASWSSTYIVRQGDNLSWIARRIYGDESRWKDIYDLNRATISNPHIIRIGQVLDLPPR